MLDTAQRKAKRLRRTASPFETAVLAFIVSLAMSAAAEADTVTFTYDALGRLTNSTTTGGPNNGVSTGTSYDPATNRTSYAVSGVPMAPVIADFGFETPAVGSSFQYNPTATGASFVQNAGVAGNGSAFGFATAPQGTQVGFLQSGPSAGGAITLNVTDLTPNHSYAVRYYAAQRPGFGVNPVQVAFQGVPLLTATRASSAFAQVTTGSFIASGATGQLTLSAGPRSSDSATAIDWVTIGAPATPGTAGAVVDYSFEEPATGNFQYNPSVAGANFAGGAGVAVNGGAFGFPTAPVGNQVGFLQGDNASISLNVSGLTVGAVYTVKFQAAKRPYNPANTTYVSFQGNALGTFAPSSASAYNQFTTIAFQANSAVGVVTFVGLSAGDTGTGLDDVQITAQ